MSIKFTDSMFANINPEGRRAAVAASFRQIADLPGLVGIPSLDLWSAFWVLSKPQEGDIPPVAARRATLRDLCEVWEESSAVGWHIRHHLPSFDAVAPWYGAQIKAWSDSPINTSRSIGPTTALPSPPRENGVRPEPLKARSWRSPRVSITSPKRSARPSPSWGEKPPN